jgi:hypothetical protein
MRADSAKSLLRLIFLLAILSFVAMKPEPTDAAGGYICGPLRNGPQSWGFGSTCEAATISLQQNAEANVSCETYCSKTLVITAACWWNSTKGMYQVDGYLRYRCEECGLIGGGCW